MFTTKWAAEEPLARGVDQRANRGEGAAAEGNMAPPQAVEETRMVALEPVPPFPAGQPKPHQARGWARKLDSAVAQRKLSSVARNKKPPGKFPEPWSEAALEPPPPLPPKPTFRDRMSHRSMVDEVERRIAYNTQLEEQIAQWWLEANHDYFLLVTDSMVQTQPGLRETLRELYHVQDGFFSGYDAVEYVKTWLRGCQERDPQHKFYEGQLEKLLKNRLKEGASTRDFATVVRRFVFDINPFIRSPYSGEKLGEFIIEELMPPYQDAIERLLNECRKGDPPIIANYELVEQAAREVVGKRAKPDAGAAAGYLANPAADSLGNGDDMSWLDGEDDDEPEPAREGPAVEERAEQHREDHPREVRVVRQHGEDPVDAEAAGEALEDGHPEGNREARDDVDDQGAGQVHVRRQRERRLARRCVAHCKNEREPLTHAILPKFGVIKMRARAWSLLVQAWMTP